MDLASLAEEPVRGERVLCILDDTAAVPGALGRHDSNSRDLPAGFVFVFGESGWTVTLSHEALELIVDPTVNILVPGPDPGDPGDASKWVLHACEVCDAVESTAYEIDGVLVSGFVTPSCFTEGQAPGTRDDFLGVGVPSFGMIEDSHVGFFDLDAGERKTVEAEAAPARSPAQTLRARNCRHKKPARPGDEDLERALLRCQSHYRVACKDSGEKALQKMTGLPRLRGFTRTARYAAAAQKIAGKLSWSASAAR